MTNPLFFPAAPAYPGPTSPLSSATLSPAFASISDRFDLTREKVNELAAALNEASSVVPINSPRVKIGLNSKIYLGNVRIPTGYQGALINASVASTLATGITLHANHVPGSFGGDGTETGYTANATTSELAPERPVWLGEGEFVVYLENVSTTTSAIASVSVLLALRKT